MGLDRPARSKALYQPTVHEVQNRYDHPHERWVEPVEINDQSGQHEANKKLSCNTTWHGRDISRMAGSPQV